MKPKLSICIPAYNRANFLSGLLDSIFSQNFNDYEIVICEDKSADREIIRSVVKSYLDVFPGVIRYFENEQNFGFDGNIRELIEKSNGSYCLFLGNDDLLCMGALEYISSIIDRNQDCGVIVRSYATFDNNPNKIKQTFRYFKEEQVFAPGSKAISIAYRRSVVIPGMVINRSAALKFSTRKFDGTLLYQLYLVGMILAKKSVVFTPSIIALRRDGVAPDFGNSLSEKGKFTPKDQTPESSIHFMEGMLDIARYIEQKTGYEVFNKIRSDIGNYSYPIISIQRKRGLLTFIRYSLSLAKLGFWRSPLFFIYFILLSTVGEKTMDALILFLKNKLGRAPSLSLILRNK